ncbi:MAG: CDP-glucose 4,6-dehydratase [Cyanobacteria bacterium]|nr:CDP-glucose 4,6-dehydratase [Cyanobacteriota bacterium]MDA1020134.1 CDP-glucose 4,6-dehydratase [Cyanobacteriota bacterium]
MYFNFFKDKKILITGHTGFKGSWLSLWLTELGANITGYALEPETHPNLFTALSLEKKIKHYIGDIRDYAKLNEVIQKEQPEIVFHMASQPLVRRSYKNPRETYEVNVMGTVNLLEAVRHCDSVRTVINITTDKVYENQDYGLAFREDDPLGGYDPYSSSKAATELVTASYRNSFFKEQGIGLASARAGNVIGGGDWSEDRLIPDCIKALESKKTIVIRNPYATRPWQHVLEPLSGYMQLAIKLNQDPRTYAQAWNFGPRHDSVINVEELVKKLIGDWGQGEYQVDKGEHVHEAKYLELDIQKAVRKLNYSPILSIEENLRMTVDWYKEFYQNPEAIQAFSLEQIKIYHKRRFASFEDALRRTSHSQVH